MRPDPGGLRRSAKRPGLCPGGAGVTFSCRLPKGRAFRALHAVCLPARGHSFFLISCFPAENGAAFLLMHAGRAVGDAADMPESFSRMRKGLPAAVLTQHPCGSFHFLQSMCRGFRPAEAFCRLDCIGREAAACGTAAESGAQAKKMPAGRAR